MTAEPVTTPARYVLVETQGPWSGPQGARFLLDGAALAEAGHAVSVFLAQDAVFAAATDDTAYVDALRRLGEAGADVVLDRFACEQRALPAEIGAGAVRTVDMDHLATAVMAPGSRVVWH